MYMCRVNGVNLEATYNNETSLTCSVDMNMVRSGMILLLMIIIVLLIS